MKVVFLGTTGSMPSPSRGASSIAVVHERELILLDCGEGTQQKMVLAGLGFGRPTTVLITHMHGDHVFGLPGLMQTMALLGRERALHVYGPKGIDVFLAFFTTMYKKPPFELLVKVITEPGLVYEGRGYRVTAVPADHDTPSWSYVVEENLRAGRFHPEKALDIGVNKGPLWKLLQEGEAVQLPSGRVVQPQEVVDPPRKGRKIAYSGDSRPTEALVRCAEDADLLVHEATFGEDLAEKAEEDGHSTPAQAAEVAFKARVGQLILTHVSPRYPDTKGLLSQARKVFAKTKIAEDLLVVELSPHR